MIRKLKEDYKISSGLLKIYNNVLSYQLDNMVQSYAEGDFGKVDISFNYKNERDVLIEICKDQAWDYLENNPSEVFKAIKSAPISLLNKFYESDKFDANEAIYCAAMATAIMFVDSHETEIQDMVDELNDISDMNRSFNGNMNYESWRRKNH